MDICMDMPQSVLVIWSIEEFSRMASSLARESRKHQANFSLGVSAKKDRDRVISSISRTRKINLKTIKQA